MQTILASSTAMLIAIILLLLLVWFVPVLIAAERRHPQTGGITILTLLAGWTVIGWVAALVWAYMGGSAPAPRTHRHTP